MRAKKFDFRLIIFGLMLTLLAGVFFAMPTEKVNAEDATYKVIFKLDNEVIKEITKNAGDVVLEGEIPTTEVYPDSLPALETEYYQWFYSTNNGQTLFRVTTKNNVNNVVIKNVSSNIIFWVKKFPNPSSYCKVTFVLPNASKVTKSVEKGGTVEKPMLELGFCQVAKFDKSLENIQEDMIINVTIDNTYKYIFMVGCLTALVTSLVVIVVVVFKTLRVPDDDEDEDDEDFSEPSNQLFE